MTEVKWDRPADRLRDSLAASVDRIRKNAALNEPARRALIAAEFDRASQEMSRLSDEHNAERARRLADASRRVFGFDDLIRGASPTERATAAISYRDAQDRVAKITNRREAEALLQSAERSGDEILARAVAGWAVDGGDQAVADQYFSNRPQQDRALADLVQASSTPTSAADLWEFVVVKPPELGTMHDQQITQLAAEAHQYRQDATS